MTPADIRAAIAALGTTQRGLARLLGVNERTVRDWCSGDAPPGATALAALRLLLAQHVCPPPATLRPEDDRDAPCGEAIDPHLDDLLARASAAGWLPAEVVAAVLTWCMHAAIDGAGKGAARELLRDARELIDLA